MKTLLTFAATLFLSTQVFAQTSCPLEAQIITKVAGIKSVSATSCTVQIDVAQTTFFNGSQLCALDLNTVNTFGVEVPLNDKQECSLAAGDTLTGVLVLAGPSRIILD